MLNPELRDTPATQTDFLPPLSTPVKFVYGTWQSVNSIQTTDKHGATSQIREELLRAQKPRYGKMAIQFPAWTAARDKAGKNRRMVRDLFEAKWRTNQQVQPIRSAIAESQHRFPAKSFNWKGSALCCEIGIQARAQPRVVSGNHDKFMRQQRQHYGQRQKRSPKSAQQIRCRAQSFWPRNPSLVDRAPLFHCSRMFVTTFFKSTEWKAPQSRGENEPSRRQIFSKSMAQEPTSTLLTRRCTN